jgi:hypothetical protein
LSIFCLQDYAMRRQKVFYDWHPIFFPFHCSLLHCGQYPSGFAANGYTSLGGFWASYTFPPLITSYFAFRGCYEIWNATIFSYTALFEVRVEWSSQPFNSAKRVIVPPQVWH